MTNNNNRHDTIIALLQHQVAARPDAFAYTFLVDGEKEEQRLTFAQLDRQARAIGAVLRAHGSEGERALLIYPTSLEYVTAIYGSLYGGMTFVPGYPPRFQQKLNDRNLKRLRVMAEDANARIAMTTAQIYARIEELLPGMPELAALTWIVTDTIQEEAHPSELVNHLRPETVAFLQYTSGSTSSPKGVMVSHHNLLAYEAMQQEAMHLDEMTKLVAWVPLFHDAGLVGHIFQSMYVGSECILMTPASFMQKPARWLQAISRHRAFMSGGPSFAFELAASKVTDEEAASMDLSCWKVAWNGSEPIRAKTIEGFHARFAHHGFAEGTFFAAYGLAESTLLITGGLFGKALKFDRIDGQELQLNRALPPRNAGQSITVVSCGEVFVDQEVVIADPKTMTLRGPGEVGEVWVSGANVARGYWNRADATIATFGAVLKDTGEGPFLRTGDLGYFKDNELYITGRANDVIIIRGRKHYPQDIEWAVQPCHPALRADAGAAFSVEDGIEEHLVLVQEVERTHRKADFAPVFEAMLQSIKEQSGLRPLAVLLLQPGSIPMTTSGKLQRSAARAGYLDGSLNVLASWEDRVPATP